MASVKFDHITFRYGANTILEDFSLEMEEGIIMGIVGPSGCGKTTLVRCLCGFIKPEKGNIYIGDNCVFSAEKRISIAPEKRNIGVVFQDYAVWPHLSVYENITYPMRKRRMSKEEIIKRADYALAQVRMTDYKKHMPAQLSGGQQQRVAIARALVTSGKLIVLDEPITNLDLKLREEMLEEIRLIQKNTGMTILYITHDQEAALRLCDRIAILDAKGRLCQTGTDEDIIYRPANRFVFTFMGVSNFIPVVKKIDGLYIRVGEQIKIRDEIPPDMEELKNPVMGVRPMDILFNEHSAVRGEVKSVTFLGNLYNYFIQLGNQQIRVQQSTLDTLGTRVLNEGERVGLEFSRALYYEEPQEGVEA